MDLIGALLFALIGEVEVEEGLNGGGLVACMFSERAAEFAPEAVNGRECVLGEVVKASAGERLRSFHALTLAGGIGHLLGYAF